MGVTASKTSCTPKPMKLQQAIDNISNAGNRFGLESLGVIFHWSKVPYMDSLSFTKVKQIKLRDLQMVDFSTAGEIFYVNWGTKWNVH